MNVKDFLQGQFSKEFSEATLMSVMLERDIPIEADYDQVTKEQLDLAKADLFKFLYTFVSQGSESIKKGSWSRTTAAISITPEEKIIFRTEANKLYKRYNKPTDFTAKDQTNDW